MKFCIKNAKLPFNPFFIRPIKYFKQFKQFTFKTPKIFKALHVSSLYNQDDKSTPETPIN